MGCPIREAIYIYVYVCVCFFFFVMVVEFVDLEHAERSESEAQFHDFRLSYCELKACWKRLIYRQNDEKYPEVSEEICFQGCPVNGMSFAFSRIHLSADSH